MSQWYCEATRRSEATTREYGNVALVDLCNSTESPAAPHAAPHLLLAGLARGLLPQALRVAQLEPVFDFVQLLLHSLHDLLVVGRAGAAGTRTLSPLTAGRGGEVLRGLEVSGVGVLGAELGLVGVGVLLFFGRSP